MRNYKSVEEITSHISNHLRATAETYVQLQKLSDSLTGYIGSCQPPELPWSTSAFEGAITKAIGNLLVHYNRAATSDTSITIKTIDSRFLRLYDLECDAVRRRSETAEYRFRTDAMDMVEYCELFLANYDFAGLTSHLASLGDSLGDRVLSEAANTIASLLNITQRSYGTRPKITAKGMTFDLEMRTFISGYEYDDIRDLLKLASALLVAEKDSNLDNQSIAIKSAGNTLFNNNETSLYPSRTVVSSYNEASVVMFKEKVKITLPRAYVESVIAFCKLHSTTPVWDFEVAS